MDELGKHAEDLGLTGRKDPQPSAPKTTATEQARARMVELSDGDPDQAPVLEGVRIDSISYGSNEYTYQKALQGLLDYLKGLSEGQTDTPAQKTVILKVLVPRYQGNNEMFNSGIKFGILDILTKSGLGINVTVGDRDDRYVELDGTEPKFLLRMSRDFDESSYGSDYRQPTYSYQRYIWTFELIAVSPDLMPGGDIQEEQ
jgi:hypothetical protein